MSEHNFWSTASEIARAYERREISPVEMVEHVLQRAERLQPRLNFLVLIDREGALAAARASEERWRRRAPLSPLDGVPTSIKDTTPLKGWPTRYGSHATDDAPAAEDAAVSGRIRAAGM
ncbi:MAG TPA: amidase family protein, partial [Reyranella sp.]|nr:amidase family protein [Reyranella sp.]